MPRGLPPRKPTRYNYSNRDFCPRARVHLIGNRPITTDYARNGMKSRLSEMISRSIDRTDHFSPSHWPLSISVSCSPGRGNLFYSALCRVCPVALFMQFFFFFFLKCSRRFYQCTEKPLFHEIVCFVESKISARQWKSFTCRGFEDFFFLSYIVNSFPNVFFLR